eukprot:scaffold59329_cov56-Phaeocystis_antarctica.AAC.1
MGPCSCRLMSGPATAQLGPQSEGGSGAQGCQRPHAPPRPGQHVPPHPRAILQDRRCRCRNSSSAACPLASVGAARRTGHT